MSNRIFIALFLFSTYIVYSIWVYTYGTELKKGEQVMSHEAFEGKLLYQELNCTSCHQIFGLGGYLGPELTNVMSAKGKDANYVKTFLKYGSRQMPSFQLDSLQARQLVSYLSYVNAASGSNVNIVDSN